MWKRSLMLMIAMVYMVAVIGKVQANTCQEFTNNCLGNEAEEGLCCSLGSKLFAGDRPCLCAIFKEHDLTSDDVKSEMENCNMDTTGFSINKFCAVSSGFHLEPSYKATGVAVGVWLTMLLLFKYS